jgi:hypothetical protein
MQTADDVHKGLIAKIRKDPVSEWKRLSVKLAESGPNAEMPELLAPIVHYLKQKIHSAEINELCKSSPYFKMFRNHVDLILWHISTSIFWYPYLSTMKAIFFTLQFLDIVVRTETPAIDAEVPYYHEYRYLNHFDKLLLLSPNVILVPTYLPIGATDLVLLRGAPIFFIGVNTTVEHVDEYKQTPAEFFIHDINHSRRQYEHTVAAGKLPAYANMTNEQFYEWQWRFSQEKLFPLVKPADTYLENNRAKFGLDEMSDLQIKGLKAVMKIILFEVLHEEADANVPESICEKIVKPSGDPAPFQFIYDNPVTGTKDIKRVIVPGGSILAFVRYKLRYGFLDAPDEMKQYIVPTFARTSKYIALGAQVILKMLDCKKIPSFEEILALVIDNEGLNPPVHPNHLRFPVRKTTFTGIRPKPLPVYMFEEMYSNGVPWTGLEKPGVGETIIENLSKSGTMVGETTNIKIKKANINNITDPENRQRYFLNAAKNSENRGFSAVASYLRMPRKEVSERELLRTNVELEEEAAKKIYQEELNRASAIKKGGTRGRTKNRNTTRRHSKR